MEIFAKEEFGAVEPCAYFVLRASSQGATISFRLFAQSFHPIGYLP